METATPRKRARIERASEAPASPAHQPMEDTLPKKQIRTGDAKGFVLQQRTVTGEPVGTPLTLPPFGLGTFRVKGSSCRKAVEHAVRSGCRHVDTAASYNNEADVAAGISDAKSASPEHVVVTTKLARGMMGKSAADIKAAVLASSAALKRDQLDILLLHWPGTDNTNVASPLHRRSRIAAWKVLEDLRDSGTVKIIGVSNFTAAHIQQLLDDGARYVPAINQVECHPFLPQTTLRQFCQTKSIHVQGYCTLGRCDEPPRCLYGKYEPSHPRLVHDPTVLEVSNRLKLTPPQVLLLWSLQHGLSVVPKSQQTQHFDENASVGLSPLPVLSSEDLKLLDDLEKSADAAFAYAYPLMKVPV